MNLPSIWLISIVVCLTNSFNTIAQPVLAQEGVMDARKIDLRKERLVLRGNWIWFDNQLLSPSVIHQQSEATIDFPKVWNEVRPSQNGIGYATYRLDVLLPSLPDSLGLEIPEAYSSYRLWVNSKVVSENGKVGTRANETQPHWESKAVTFARPGDTLQLVLQVANFHHHKGGMKGDIRLAESNLTTQKFLLTRNSTLAECISLFTMAFIFLLLFFQQKRKKVILYFALLCFTWAVRSVFSNNYVFTSSLPGISWDTMVRIEYLTIYLTVICCVFFLNELFPNERSQIIKYLLGGANTIFILLTLLTTPLAFTRWISIYLLVAGVLIVYGIITIIRAVINERVGSTFLTFCCLLAAILFAYDIFTYQGLFNYHPVVLSIGYVILFLLMAIALLLYLNIIKSKPKPTSMLTYADLYKDDQFKIK